MANEKDDPPFLGGEPVPITRKKQEMKEKNCMDAMSMMLAVHHNGRFPTGAMKKNCTKIGGPAQHYGDNGDGVTRHVRMVEL